MGDGVFSGGGNSGSNLNPLGKFDTLHQVTLTFETKKATHYSKRSCQQPNEKQTTTNSLYRHYNILSPTPLPLGFTPLYVLQIPFQISLSSSPPSQNLAYINSRLCDLP